jgi:chitinase
MRILAALAAAATLFAFSVVAAMAAPPGKPLVVGYVFPDGAAIQPGEVAAGKLTRINYAFADIKGGRMVAGSPADAQNLAMLVALKKENPSLTVLASVGGWTWSGGFSDMALTRQSRSLFIQSAVEFIEQHQLDGLDVDWEYPGMAGLTNHFRPQDKQNYTLLLSELRTRLDQEEKRLHRRLFLTIAVGGESDFIEHTEMGEVQKYVDTVNLMAYDYYEPPNDKLTGNHTPLFTDPADPKKISASQSIQNYENAGVPAAKIVLGVPFYGHAWGQVPDRDHGLFQPGGAVPNLDAGFANISASMLNKGFTRYWDAAASAPYLYSPAKHIFVSYEDQESLALKCKYVLSHHLGGVMFWDYASDPSGTLLNTVDQQLHISASSK